MSTLLFGACTISGQLRELLKTLSANKFADRTINLPLAFASSDSLLEIILQYKPSAMLGLGPICWSPELETEPELSKAIRVEQFALNMADSDQPDDRGFLSRDKPVVAKGPNGYASTADATAITNALLGAGHAAVTSYFAGTWTTNSHYYQALHSIAQQKLTTQCVFLHLPCDMIGPESWLEQVAQDSWPNETLSDAIGVALTQMNSPD